MSGIFNTVDENRNKDIILPTVLKVGTEEIEYWTNMTCFYDKTWEFDPALSTTPIAFMHITSITESIEAQGAEKRVILYEAPVANDGFATSTAHPAYKNNLEVIMDNVVVKPKQYQMEVIIPDSLIGPYHKQGLARLEALLLYMDMADTTGSDSTLLNGITNTLRFVQSFLDTVETATSLIDTILGATLGSSQMSTINKNSLQAMASKGHVVLFKKWTGYDYSYGLITKIDISKKPTEEGVYRGSITFQETPILNISQKKVSTSAISWKDAARYGAAQTARVLNLALALPFMSVTGVVDEAGAPGTKNATGNTIDLF